MRGYAGSSIRRPARADDLRTAWMRRFVPGPVSECWEWLGYRVNGYGRLTDRFRKAHGAHRLAWEFTYGPIPAGLYVCHRCDNRACVNPLHLWLGTHADNMADMSRKGRHPMGPPARRGENHSQAKLTDAQVAEIRVLHQRGVNQSELGRRFGVRPNTVNQIVRMKARV